MATAGSELRDDAIDALLTNVELRRALSQQTPGQVGGRHRWRIEGNRKEIFAKISLRFYGRGVEPRRIDVNPAMLKALAHPLRQRILFALRVMGPSTATLLAEQMGESSGLTSYHLRALASAGLVEEVPERGNGRDRWWRAAHDVSGFQPSDFEGTEAAPAAEWMQSQADRNREREVATWTAERHDWPLQWREVADRSDYYFLATPDEAGALLESLHDLLLAATTTTIARRDGHEAVPDGAGHIRLHLLAFPVRELAGMRLSSPDETRDEEPRTAAERPDGPTG